MFRGDLCDPAGLLCSLRRSCARFRLIGLTVASSSQLVLCLTEVLGKIQARWPYCRFVISAGFVVPGVIFRGRSPTSLRSCARFRLLGLTVASRLSSLAWDSGSLALLSPRHLSQFCGAGGYFPRPVTHLTKVLRKIQAFWPYCCFVISAGFVVPRVIFRARSPTSPRSCARFSLFGLTFASSSQPVLWCRKSFSEAGHLPH